MYIRASTASDANTYSYQKLVIDGLTYQPSAYYFLRLTNINTGESYDVNSSGYNGGGSSPNYYTIALTFDVEPSTSYTYKAEARYLSGNSLTTVTNVLTSPEDPNTPVRPGYFSWTYTKSTGSPFNVTANEWNALTTNLNEVEFYKKGSDTWCTIAYPGDSFTASMFNEVATAIRSMTSSAPSNVGIGTSVTASRLNQLVTSLNSIS